MNDEVYADERLENIAAKLAGHGFDVNGPSTDKPLPDEPDTGYIAVCNPVTRQCAEVCVVRYSSNPSDVFLQLSYWTDPGRDPDGSQMAEGGDALAFRSRMAWISGSRYRMADGGSGKQNHEAVAAVDIPAA
jgi:hypothetical protein